MYIHIKESIFTMVPTFYLFMTLLLLNMVHVYYWCPLSNQHQYTFHLVTIIPECFPFV